MCLVRDIFLHPAPLSTKMCQYTWEENCKHKVHKVKCIRWVSLCDRNKCTCCHLIMLGKGYFFYFSHLTSTSITFRRPTTLHLYHCYQVGGTATEWCQPVEVFCAALILSVGSWQIKHVCSLWPPKALEWSDTLRKDWVTAARLDHVKFSGRC